MSDFAVMYYSREGKAANCLIRGAATIEEAIERAKAANSNPEFGVHGLDPAREIKAVEVYGLVMAVGGKIGELSYDHILVADVRKAANGANNHTVNKAVCYYDLAYREKRWTMMGLIANQARVAMVTGDWSQLRGFMANWF
jgi:hypothetical protein